MADGKITRKEIISDDAINWGASYAKNIQSAIDATNDLVKISLKLNETSKRFTDSTNEKDFNKAQVEKAKLLKETSIALEKEQKAIQASIVSKQKQTQLEEKQVSLIKKQIELENIKSRQKTVQIEQKKLDQIKEKNIRSKNSIDIEKKRIELEKERVRLISQQNSLESRIKKESSDEISRRLSLKSKE